MNRFLATILAAAIAIAAVVVDADAKPGKGRGKPTTTTTTTIALPACIPWDPSPPTCIANGRAVIDDEIRDEHCLTYCCDAAFCIPSDFYGFPNCWWPSSGCD